MAPPKPDKRNGKERKLKAKPQRKKQNSVVSSYSTAAISMAVVAALLALCLYVKQNSDQSLDKTTINSKTTTSNVSDFMNFNLLPRRNGVKVGHISEEELEPGKVYQIKTLSLQPPIFEIPDFLPAKEANLIIKQAKTAGLERSEVVDPETQIKIEPTTPETFREWDYNNDGTINKTEVMHNLVDLSDLYFSESDVEKMFQELRIDKNQNGVMDLKEFLDTKTDRIMKYLHRMAKYLPRTRSRHSAQTWLDHRHMKALDKRVSALTLLPLEVIKGSEELQVVSYGPEGHYHCHHDSQDIDPKIPCCYHRDNRRCRLCRYITILYFLNDVDEGGETAFPIANNETFSYEAWAKITKYRCDLSRHCHKANLYVQPKRGKAIMWYNHLRDPRTGWFGHIDPMTYHGGCDIIKGEKWIANNWINILGDSKENMVSYKNHKKKIFDH